MILLPLFFYVYDIHESVTVVAPSAESDYRRHVDHATFAKPPVSYGTRYPCVLFAVLTLWPGFGITCEMGISMALSEMSVNWLLTAYSSILDSSAFKLSSPCLDAVVERSLAKFTDDRSIWHYRWYAPSSRIRTLPDVRAGAVWACSAEPAMVITSAWPAVLAGSAIKINAPPTNYLRSRVPVVNAYVACWLTIIWLSGSNHYERAAVTRYLVAAVEGNWSPRQPSAAGYSALRYDAIDRRCRNILIVVWSQLWADTIVMYGAAFAGMLQHSLTTWIIGRTWWRALL